MLDGAGRSADGVASAALEARDDYLHGRSDSPWETETCWFSFYDETQSLTGYLYVVARPNLGVCAGGALLWDASAYLPWEVPHFDYQWHLPSVLTEGSSFEETPVGVRVEVLEPLKRYRLQYSRDEVSLDLTFDAIGAPHIPQVGEPPFAAAHHLDQPGHVTGTLRRGGTTTAIDCLAMRDRSWGPRDDRRPGRFGYAFASLSPTEGFLSYSKPRRDGDRIFAGYLMRDGIRSRLVSGNRTVHRDAVHGGPVRVRIEALDELDRALVAEGAAINRLCFTPYPRMVNWTTTLRWTIGKLSGIGEDQDVWPIERWAASRRGAAGTEPLVIA